MRILLTIFEIQDYGGIVGDIEYLMKGLRHHGHEVDLVLLRDNDRDPSYRKLYGPKGSYRSEAGGECNTLAGWYGIRVLGYGSDRRLGEWRSFADSYDLVIHEIPGPKPSPNWLKIYDISPVQLIAAHDAHFRDMYPHIALLAGKVKGISCTNHAGYKSLEWCPIPRAFIGAAHEPLDWLAGPVWHQKSKNSVCAHVWKAWKHMDQVVAAAPHLKTSGVVMGGDGIEGRYMRSIEKVKPKYKGLWEAALASGRMSYAGLVSHEKLFDIYEKSRVMVDMSYSRKFHALGNHFNRSIIEAGNSGCISICTTENMHENSPQVPLFEDGQTHVAVSTDIDPQELAEVMDWAVNLTQQAVIPMIANVREILMKYFDYKKVCLEYLKLANGEPAGVYPVLETGTPPEGFMEQAQEFANATD